MNREINTNRISFLNTYIDNLTAEEAKKAVDQFIQADGFHYVVTPNSDIVVKMQDNPELKNICDNADLILTDGQIVVKLSKWLGNPIKERVCMTDFVWDVFDLAVEKGYKVFLFGGKEDVLRKATENIKKRVPKLHIVDSYSPPFGFEKNEEQLNAANERIKNSGADILIVFLGCPKQEKFIASNKEKYQIPGKVQAIIPVRTVYPDGIFLSGKGKYSKTFRFRDINYAVASRSDKEMMFLEYS